MPHTMPDIRDTWLSRRQAALTPLLMSAADRPKTGSARRYAASPRFTAERMVGGVAMTEVATANAEALRRGYEAFQAGNLDVLRNELFAPDIVWHAPGRNQLSGDFHGVDAVIGLFTKQFELTGGTFRVEVHDILASDEHAVAIASLSSERDGKTYNDLYTHVCHYEDGRLKEAWIVSFNPYQGDELFG